MTDRLPVWQPQYLEQETSQRPRLIGLTANELLFVLATGVDAEGTFVLHRMDGDRSYCVDNFLRPNQPIWLGYE